MIDFVILFFLIFFILPNVFFSISGAAVAEYGNPGKSRLARLVQNTPGYKIGFWLGSSDDA
jgi:hypothetical protein